jgi:hypothetical protein
LTEQQLTFLDQLEVDVGNKPIMAMLEMLVVELRSHVCNTKEQMARAHKVAEKLAGLKLAPEELLDPDLAPALLWETESLRAEVSAAGIDDADLTRLRKAIEKRAAPPQGSLGSVPSAAAPVSAGKGGGQLTPLSSGGTASRTSSNLTIQLANVFAVEIEKGLTPLQVMTSLVSC